MKIGRTEKAPQILKRNLSKNSGLEKKWEKILQNAGMPSEIIPEQIKAAQAGVLLDAPEMSSPEAVALKKRLQEEDPRNVLGGFPSDINTMVTLVQDLREEWLAQDVKPKDIHIVVHESCINDSDCLTLAYNGGNIYHFNTKHTDGYSRQKLFKQLEAHNLSFVEK